MTRVGSAADLQTDASKASAPLLHRHGTVMAVACSSHTQTHMQKCQVFHLQQHSNTHVAARSQRRVLDTETASIDWKEDCDDSGGLREAGRERAGEEEIACTNGQACQDT